MMTSLRFSCQTWASLLADLRQRGQSRRESGAFLLGREVTGANVVYEWIPYDELDARSLNYDYVRLGSEAFSALWKICEKKGLQVVADVHTHPLGPTQSPSDRANPMVSIAGHTALIVPRFATGEVQLRDISVNVYLGSKKWTSYLGSNVSQIISIS